MNARSIRNKPAGIKSELAKLGIDVLLFSESFLNDDDKDDLYLLDDYNMYRHDRVSIHRGGGLVAHIANDMTCSPGMFSHLNRGCLDIEIQWLYVQKGKGRKTIVANVYRPPRGNLLNFCNTIKALLLQK